MLNNTNKTIITSLITSFTTIAVAALALLKNQHSDETSGSNRYEHQPVNYTVTIQIPQLDSYAQGETTAQAASTQGSTGGPYSSNAQEASDPTTVVAQSEPDLIRDIFVGEKVGIYYSLGDSSAGRKGGELRDQMRAMRINATLYSIGKFYSSPQTPSLTYIYGASVEDEKSFTDAFHETFNYIGEVELGLLNDLKEDRVVEESTWKIDFETAKDVYIIVGS